MKLKSKLMLVLITNSAIFASFLVFGLITIKSHSVIIDDDGNIRTVSTRAANVQGLLKERGIDEDATVVSNLEENISNGLKVVIRYSKPVKLIIDGELKTKNVTSVNIKEGLKQLGVKPSKDDFVSKSLNAHIPKNGLNGFLIVSTMKKINLISDGKKKSVSTNAPQIKDLLYENKIKTDDLDEINKSIYTFIKPGMTVKVVDVEKKEVTDKVKLPIKTKVKKDSTLTVGEERVISTGIAPIVKQILTITYADKKVRSKKVVREIPVSRGAPRVVLKGTKPAPSTAPTGGGCGGWGNSIKHYFDASQYNTACRVMMCESGGNPKAQNPHSTASGIFQFLDGSWRSAAAAVPGASKYSRAMNAPGDMQVEVAAKWLARTSWQQWSCY